MEAVHQIVDLIFAAGDESERDNLALGEQDKRALAQGDFLAAWLAEISPQQVPLLNVERIRFALGLEAFGSREIVERAEVVFSTLEAGIGRHALGGDYDRGVDGLSRGLRRALENRQQNFGFAGLISLLHLGAAINPAVGDLIAERKCGVAIKLGVIVSRGGLGTRLRNGCSLALCLRRESQAQANNCNNGNQNKS